MDGIKRISKQDALDVIQLSSFAFQLDWTEEYMIKRAERLVPDEYWGYFVNGELAAKLRIIPLSSLFYGRAFKMGGIASVATWPQYRRNGMVAKLLTHALEVMKEAGQTVSILHPFSFAFYRKYGWEMNTEFKRYTFESDLLEPIADEGGTMVRLKHIEEEWPLLNELYMKYALQYNGMLYRDITDWKHTILEDKKRMAVVFYNEVGKPEGYLLYHIEKGELQVKEMIFITEAARLKMWNFICSHQSMVSKVTMIVSRDDQLPFLLHEPRIKQETVPYSMARIVDVKGFLEQVRFQPSSSGETHQLTREFTIRIKDEQAVWNDGVFEVHIDEAGKATVTKISEHSGRGNYSGDDASEHLDCATSVGGFADADMSCDIQTFSAIMTGYQRPLDCLRYNRLRGAQQKIQQLDDSLPHLHVHLLDFF